MYSYKAATYECACVSIQQANTPLHCMLQLQLDQTHLDKLALQTEDE